MAEKADSLGTSLLSPPNDAFPDRALEGIVYAPYEDADPFGPIGKARSIFHFSGTYPSTRRIAHGSSRGRGSG
jgi:hypothetical protein